MENKIIKIFTECNQVIDFEIDYEDCNYTYDFLVTLKNNNDIYKAILKLTFLIECLNMSVHTLYEQIEDEINENKETITIDFYIDKLTGV